MTAVNATVPSVVLLIYIFITVAIVAKHVIVDTYVVPKNVTVLKVTVSIRKYLLQINEVTMIKCMPQTWGKVMRNGYAL